MVVKPPVQLIETQCQCFSHDHMVSQLENYNKAPIIGVLRDQLWPAMCT